MNNMLSVFTLPFDLRAFPYDWLIVCLILLNILAVIAYIAAYIEFKVKPPLPKFNIHGSFEYLMEFTSIRGQVFCTVLLLDIVIFLAYVGMVSAKITHLILFE